MKKIILLFILCLGFISTSSYARDIINGNVIIYSGNGNGHSRGNEYYHRPVVYICVLKPFMDVYAEAGVSEKAARKQVAEACDEKRGKNSIFCKRDDAICHQSEVGYSEK